jgi:chitinase
LPPLSDLPIAAGKRLVQAGVFDYGDLVANYIGQGDWTRYWSADSQVPCLYSPSQQVMISYDDEESTTEKLDYIIANDLGGVMFWELSSDTPNHDLVELMATKLRP